MVAPALAAVEQEGLEEIVVSAQRREEPVTKVPISISAFTAAAIETNQIRTVQDYFAKAPNLTISQGETRSGNVSASSHGLSIRGISNVGGDSSSYGFYIDDFNVTRATVNPQLVDVSHHRGAARTAGHIFRAQCLCRSHQPQYQQAQRDLGGNAALQYGRFNEGEASGTINVPVSDRFMLRASGKFAQSDGYADNDNASVAIMATSTNMRESPRACCPRITGRSISQRR